MAAVVISTGTTFGGMTVQTVGRMVQLNATLARLAAAIANASSGWQGTPGAEFELNSTMGGAVIPPANGDNMPAMANNFGVHPDPRNPGSQGQAFAYAVNELQRRWGDFWPQIEPFIRALDNGGSGL